MPRWLTVLLVTLAVIVLGPPALGLLFAALGLAIGLGALALKLGVIAFGCYLIYLFFEAVLGKPKTRAEQVSAEVDQMDASRRALDEELDRAVAAARK